MKRLSYFTVTAFLVFAANAAMAKGAGVPQMDQTWYANQLFWLAISFSLLFMVVSQVIAPSIHSVLQRRETEITNAVAEAEFARSEAQATQGVAAQTGQSARAQAAELMAQAQAEASRDAASELAKLDHELERKASHADAVLEDALAKAHAGVDAAAQQLAEAIAAQLLGFPAGQSVDGPKLKLAKR